ncbi:MAG: cytochrome c oxidase subunit II [Alphaproteobacteria bacterium]|nr:cytochrome c oxidase subunit II [Alphaproteobacteria bacterium]
MNWQSALDPHSANARHLADLFWFFTALCAAIWLLVVAALLRAIRHPGLAGEQDPPERQLRKSRIVGALTALTVLILVVFTAASFYTTRSFAWPDMNTLRIKVTGQQWWWQVEYRNHDASQVLTTANEIHIPVGRPVTLELHATDVIHSFWVPDLMGKQDLIPGRTNYLTLQADHAGVYRGQCAEFCGLEHARMAIWVFAQEPSAFEAWRRHALMPNTMPDGGAAAKGAYIFVHRQCASCHAINGSDAAGQTGPDLTHFGARATIAAGTLHNTAANLDRWLADPQAVKPGANMPKVDLSAPDRAALVAFLEGLK